MAAKAGPILAKALGIRLDERDPVTREGKDDLTRGESVFSVSSADAYVEPEPTAGEWLTGLFPGRRGVVTYFHNLFPFTHWIGRYNLTWLAGDLVAGITVGAVVVPQSMAYALLASLPPEFGLYSSFMGVLIYWFFATSKDITIGPVAVMSTIVGNIVIKLHKTNPEIPGYVVAQALAVIAGSIILFIGLIRAGWIVDFISLAAISAFMTGSAINIAAGQVPTLMGITGFSTRDSTYLVIIHTLKYLGRTKIDAALGLTALALLYIIRSACNFAAKRWPSRKKTFFFIATLRTAFVILLYVMISWLVNRNRRKKPLFKILGTVPRGFKHAGAPPITTKLIKAFAVELPASVIVLLIEHIAIAKSFGRVNHYMIDPSQELVAIGVTNVLGPFLGAYPATGSFSRTAIKSKAGVRTPFAGVITALVVLLAIYALPAVFFYIPSAGLSAVIIHAVGDLITPPNTVYQFWKISPLEVIIFFVGVFVTIFSSIENGIYATICISLAILLFRVVKAQGRFLGKVKVRSVVGDHLLGEEGKTDPSGRRTQKPNDSDSTHRDIFLPIDHKDGSNPEIEVDSPYPGIFIYRFSEGFNYPNANHYLDYLTNVVFKTTRRTDPFSYPRPGDRPWNDPGPKPGQEHVNDALPTLKAIILDFSSVNNVDITSVQHLIDVRNQLDRWAAPSVVEWHIASITNRWTKRALANAGFGYPTSSGPEFTRWKPIFSVAEIGGSSSAATAAQERDNKELLRQRTRDLESQAKDNDAISKDFAHATAGETSNSPSQDGFGGNSKLAVVQGLNRPLFHVDLNSALHSAIHNVEWRHKDEVAELSNTANNNNNNTTNDKVHEI